MSATYGPFDAVIAIEPVNGHQAVVEHYMNETHVICTEDDCPFGVERAARAWAAATGAAYAEDGHG